MRRGAGRALQGKVRLRAEFKVWRHREGLRGGLHTEMMIGYDTRYAVEMRVWMENKARAGKTSRRWREGVGEREAGRFEHARLESHFFSRDATLSMASQPTQPEYPPQHLSRKIPGTQYT